jgi:hypothetical protein
MESDSADSVMILKLPKGGATFKVKYFGMIELSMRNMIRLRSKATRECLTRETRVLKSCGNVA